jgi:hypothetical protein
MRSFLWRNRSELLIGGALIALATAFAATGLAGPIGNNTDPPGTLDTYANFSIIDTNHPATAAGRVTKIDYYAGATLPMAFMVVSGSAPTFTVKHISANFTPGAVGVQTFTPPPSWMVSPGDNIGMYFASTGVIPFASGGSPAAWEPNNSGKPAVGETLSLEAGASNRTYSFVATVLEPTTGCSGPASSYAGFTQVGSTLFVPASQVAATVGPLFANGIAYRVEAAGVFDAGGDSIYADAEYSQDATQASWTKYVNGYEPAAGDETANYLLDLRVNGNPLDWGGFAASHVYTHDLLGTGTPATFGFDVYDSYPSNNVGGLCVSVFEDDLAPVVDSVVVNPGMVKVGSTVTVTARADDTTKNGSDLASAEVTLDGGATWTPLAATDGAFDEPTEDLTGSVASVPAGIRDVCVRAADQAGNVGVAGTCAVLKVYDRWAKVGGVVVGESGAPGATASLNVPTDKGEPDWAFDGWAYGGGTAAWGSVHVNYKSVADGPVNCTFTPGASGTFVAYGPGERPRVDLLGWSATCSNGTSVTASIQLVPRDTTSWGGIVTSARAMFPRGGVFLNGEPYAYPYTGPFDLYSGYAAFDLWVPLDRGNVHTWVDT